MAERSKSSSGPAGGGGGNRPVPMKLFATWEVDRTPSNCIPRLALSCLHSRARACMPICHVCVRDEQLGGRDTRALFRRCSWAFLRAGRGIFDFFFPSPRVCVQHTCGAVAVGARVSGVKYLRSVGNPDVCDRSMWMDRFCSRAGWAWGEVSLSRARHCGWRLMIDDYPYIREYVCVVCCACDCCVCVKGKTAGRLLFL